MRAIRERMIERQRRLPQHRFFARLQGDEPFENVMAFAPGLMFWVLTFQDILRLNEARVQDPDLARLARFHREEEAGHDRWFFDDLAVLEHTRRDLEWLYSDFHASTREAAYALVSEVYRLADDRLRIALLFALESVGEVFFDHVTRFIERSGYQGPLRYFARTHLQIERDHKLLVGDLEDGFYAMELPPDVRAEGLALVDRVFDGFERMFDGLAGRIMVRDSGTFAIRGAAARVGEGVG